MWGEVIPHQNPQSSYLLFMVTSDNASLGYYGIEGASDGNVITVYPAGLPEEGPQRNRRDP